MTPDALSIKSLTDETSHCSSHESGWMLCMANCPTDATFGTVRMIWNREEPVNVLGSTATTTIKKAIYGLLESCGTHDWDGEGGDPVVRETANIAAKLICYFPNVDHPDIFATPHGEIDFEWMFGETMLTISVTPPPHRIAFAGRFGESRVQGIEMWNGSIPMMVKCCLQKLK